MEDPQAASVNTLDDSSGNRGKIQGGRLSVPMPEDLRTRKNEDELETGQTMDNRPMSDESRT